MTNHILVGGASRGVGREIVKCLRQRNLPTIALLRSPDTAEELINLGASIAIADAMNFDQLAKAIDQPIKAIITSIGGLPQDGVRPDFLANKNLIDLAVKLQVEKFILVTSIGTAESVVALSPQALQTLSQVLLEKEKAEKHLRDSGLTYTIIRPGGLKSEPATGKAILTENYRISGMIHRADVAQLACDCLMSDKANHKTLSAVDPNQLFNIDTFDIFQP